MGAVNELGKQHHAKVTANDKDQKRLDLFGWKSYSSATIQFWIDNTPALMFKYNHVNYAKLNECVQHVPLEQRKQFQSVTAEGQLLAWISLDTADAVACCT